MPLTLTVTVSAVTDVSPKRESAHRCFKTLSGKEDLEEYWQGPRIAPGPDPSAPSTAHLGPGLDIGPVD